MPTSLTYIVLSTRGCSPWRPAAVIGTTGCDSTEPTCLRFPRTFTGSRERTGRHNKCGAMPESDDPISGQPDSREHTPSRRKGNSSRGSRRRLRVRLRCRQRPRPPPHSGSGMLTRFPFGARYLHPAARPTRTRTGNGHPFQANRGDFPFPQDRLTRVQLLFTRNPSPLQSSRSSLEYLLLPPRSAPEAAPSMLAPRTALPRSQCGDFRALLLPGACTLCLPCRCRATRRNASAPSIFRAS